MSSRQATVPPWAWIGAAAAIVVMLWIAGQTLGRVLFVFLVSVVIALLLNPLVRMVRRMHVPRGLAVATVFLSFLGVVAAAIVLLIPPIQEQINTIRANLPLYTDQAQRQVQTLQGFFDRNSIDVDVQERAAAAFAAIKGWANDLSGNAVSYSLSALGALVIIIIIFVAAVYMLLDAPQIARAARRLGGPSASQFLVRTERTLVEYIKAQTLVCLIIAVSTGVVLWILGVTGVFPQGATYAVLFAAWIFIMEFIPYIGPILGAIPPVLLALFISPWTALWVLIAFIAIHQFEGHVVVPQVMGDAVGVHPLVVIFGVLIGEELYGFIGIILAVPVVVILKETAVYMSERMGWFGLSLATAGAPGGMGPETSEQDTLTGLTLPPRRTAATEATAAAAPTPAAGSAANGPDDGDTLDVTAVAQGQPARQTGAD
ncbi:MAG: AI-2E family transporter [Acidobacteria bacterium]|nr:AI-2E family transporter [Acidobacteriota bacterium]